MLIRTLMPARPGPNNTGYSGTLSAYGGPSTITADDTLIENVIVNGTLTVNADNVTIRNCEFDGLGGGFWGIRHTQGGQNLLVEDCEIWNHNQGTSGSQGVQIASGSTGTVRRCNIHTQGGDGLKSDENDGPVVFQGNWIHNLGSAPSAHGDGIQCRGASNIKIVGNYIDMPTSTGNNHNAGVLLQADIGDVDNVLIAYNWFDVSNQEIFLDVWPTPASNVTNAFPTNVVVHHNRHFGNAVSEFQDDGHTGEEYTAWLNVFDDTGLTAGYDNASGPP